MQDNDVDRVDDTDNALRGDARKVDGDPHEGVERDGGEEGGSDRKARGGGTNRWRGAGRRASLFVLFSRFFPLFGSFMVSAAIPETVRH